MSSKSSGHIQSGLMLLDVTVPYLIARAAFFVGASLIVASSAVASPSSATSNAAVAAATASASAAKASADAASASAEAAKAFAAANVPVTPGSAPSMESMQYKGLLGDYIGGVFGTLIGLLTLVLVGLAWLTSRRIDYKTKTYQVFAEMLRTHEEIVSSIDLGGTRGREAIALILSEFSFIYKATRSFVPSDEVWPLRQRIDIAYTYTYYGAQLQTQRILNQHNPALLKLIGDSISRKRQSGTRGRSFGGHQNRLSHYFRNLYAAYSFINSSDLSDAEKESLGKVLRAKLSNYEQALLVLNVICHLGSDWNKTGLLKTYMPIKNVPKNFFSFDENFDLKREFPFITFEWESPRGAS